MRLIQFIGVFIIVMKKKEVLLWPCFAWIIMGFGRGVDASFRGSFNALECIPKSMYTEINPAIRRVVSFRFNRVYSLKYLLFTLIRLPSIRPLCLVRPPTHSVVSCCCLYIILENIAT